MLVRGVVGVNNLVLARSAVVLRNEDAMRDATMEVYMRLGAMEDAGLMITLRMGVGGGCGILPDDASEG